MFLNGVKENLSSVTHNFPKKGLYQSYIYVTNQCGVSSDGYSLTNVYSDETLIANYKLSTYFGTAPLTVNFDGTSSHARASSASITDYYWELDNYPEADNSSEQAQFSYTFNKHGTRYMDFIVRDSNGNFGFNHPKVVVLDSDDVPANNQNPSVVINRAMTDGLRVSMDSTMSDADGEILFSEWDWGDGDVEVFRHSEEVGSHSYSSGGMYTITVRVFDNHGGIATATREVTLQEDLQRSLRGSPASFKKSFSSQQSGGVLSVRQSLERRPVRRERS